MPTDGARRRPARFTFSLLVNQAASSAAGQTIEDRVGDALVGYPAPVDQSRLGLGG